MNVLRIGFVGVRTDQVAKTTAFFRNVVGLKPLGGTGEGHIGLVLLSLSVGLLIRSDWSSRTRVVTSLVVVGGTVALFILVIALWFNN